MNISFKIRWASRKAADMYAEMISEEHSQPCYEMYSTRLSCKINTNSLKEKYVILASWKRKFKISQYTEFQKDYTSEN